MRNQTTRSGFTLLEMLVALALVGVIAGALYGSLYIAYKAHERAHAAITPIRRAELAATLIRRDIESVLPPTGILAAEFVGEDATDDSGRPADALVVHCCSHVPQEGEPASDIRKVELTCETLEEDIEETQAIIRRSTTSLLATETPDPIEDVLCRDVLAFNLRYFDGTEWLDAWDSTTQSNDLPLAVEVTIEVGRILPDGSEEVEHSVVRVLRILCEGPSATSEGLTVQRGGSGGGRRSEAD